jgi:hypothetical protein
MDGSWIALGELAVVLVGFAAAWYFLRRSSR